VCIAGTCIAAPKCDAKTPCPAGLACAANGLCSSCYSWRPWTLKAGLQVPPRDLYGYGEVIPGEASYPSVAASQITPGTWDFGWLDAQGMFSTVAADGTIPSYNPPQVMYLAAGAACPPAATVSDATRAFQFQGTPVCMDFAQQGVLTPYKSGACRKYPQFSPQPLGLA
jgi:hypothetical protein